MDTAFFDFHRFERIPFEEENAAQGNPHKFSYIDALLNSRTAPLARGSPAICVFVNDRVDQAVLEILAPAGLKLVALRCAGFNNVNIGACHEYGIKVVRVPAYSPYAVAEHTLALILALNRKIHRAYARVRELNFSLDGLLGFDLHNKTLGILGTGKIGSVVAHIGGGLGMRVLAYDPCPNEELKRERKAEYVALEDLFRESDIITLHIPLSDQTRYIINARSIASMKPGVLIINTGRGALIDTRALISALKRKKIAGAGLDVYEEEEGIFSRDLSEQGLDDDILARLLTFSNVIVTAHQAFLTKEALQNIAQVTVQNIAAFESGQPLVNEVLPA